MSNIQARQTIQKITEALLNLMEKEPFEDITVTDITRQAGVARLTFYRHFENKEQVLLTHLDAIFESYLSEILKMDDMNLRDGLCRCFEYWKRDKRLPGFLARPGTVPLIQQSFGRYLQRVLDTNIHPRKFSYFQKKFIEGGLLLTMTDWLANPRGLTPEDMADMIIDLINSSGGAI
jgi:AcrR family transcriptional regulator